jgi:hypothetical protein
MHGTMPPEKPENNEDISPFRFLVLAIVVFSLIVAVTVTLINAG